jgi:hypothetical protein
MDTPLLPSQNCTLLVEETNHYQHYYTDTFDYGLTPEADVSEAEMFLFLALTMQMGYGIRDKLTHCWAAMYQLYTPFYGTMIKWYRYNHILRYLHFNGNRNEPDRKDKNSHRMWKI